MMIHSQIVWWQSTIVKEVQMDCEWTCFCPNDHRIGRERDSLTLLGDTLKVLSIQEKWVVPSDQKISETHQYPDR